VASAENGARAPLRRLKNGLVLLLAICAHGSAQQPAAAQPPDDGVALAEQAPLVRKSLLLDIVRAEGRIVAVGDRGHIVLSDDEGESWVQARSVATRNLLTGVCFSDAKHGIAVGHDEIVLVTEDAGRTWTRTHYAPESQQPLLDVWCGPQGKAIAVGAYGTYYSSGNGGETWTARRLDATPLLARTAASADSTTQTAASAPAYEEGLGGDPHLNRIVAASATRFYIAGEAGHLYRSDDAGATWVQLLSPYEGSFFGVLPLEGEALLAYGLRGHLYRSENAGASWTKIETGTTAMLNDAARIAARQIVVVGLSGTLLDSQDDGRTFSLRLQSGRKGLCAVMAADPPEVIVAGEDGIRRISLEGGAP
jgi:photosystem II stability/assembly factor-like uncharacterized protein